MNMSLDQVRIAIIGLGYVGLPLAVELGKKYPVVGFDIQRARIEALRIGRDSTNEFTADAIRASTNLVLSDDAGALAGCNVFIVTVPTPVDSANRPDFGPLIAASRTVGATLKAGNLVIYESTVYPGATEDVCVPVLERQSGLVFNRDFFCGYSPERINPGDKERRLTTIKKITSGSTPAAADFVDALYRSIVTAGTHKASSMKVAEAAKIIENIQRDLNIALMNELAQIFSLLGIDTLEVLQAAGTKWNFLPFRPGLVGGHCIGIDPYYLTHKAAELGYHPEVIVAGRRINDSMGEIVADRIVKLMLRKRIAVADSRILILGLAFKENCADTRNTRVFDLIGALEAYSANVDVYDPCVDREEAAREYGIEMLGSEPAEDSYDAIVLAVPHEQFLAWGGERIARFGRARNVLFDVKSALPRSLVDARL